MSLRIFASLLVVVGSACAQTLSGGVAIRGTVGSPSAASTIQQSAIIIGQSLAAGGGSGTSAISLTQPYTNLMFVGGVLRPATLTSYSPLIEGTGTAGVARETIASGFANQIAAFARAASSSDATRDLLMSNWATDGQPYSVLKKGGTGTNFADSLTAITYSAAHLPSGKTGISVGVVLCVHGEANASDAGYAADLAQWQSDYQGDIQTATGQTATVPLFVSEFQQYYVGGLYDAYAAHPDKVVLVGPKYFLAHSDSLHLTSAAYITLGEYYARAYWKMIVQGTQWHPLRPTTVTRTGAVITVTYGSQGRTGNLVFDTTIVTALADGNYGFTYLANSGGAVISSVVITDAANGVVTITLTSDPSANNGGWLTYAPAGASGGGPVTGSRGNLRDSDTTVGLDGAHLYNWATNWQIHNGVI